MRDGDDGAQEPNLTVFDSSRNHQQMRQEALELVAVKQLEA